MDTDLLALQYELIDHLGQRGYAWFADFSSVEVDLSGGELRVHLISAFDMPFQRAVYDFGMANKLPRLSYSKDRHIATLRRAN